MNEWHNEDKGAINKKIITLIVMLAAATSLAILFAFHCSHFNRKGFRSLLNCRAWLLYHHCCIVVALLVHN